MKYIVGILIIIGGVALGLYLGIYVCLYGGVVMLIEGCKQNPISAGDIAFGIIRILATSLVGWGSFFLCAVAGGGVLNMRSNKPKRLPRGPWDHPLGL